MPFTPQAGAPRCAVVDLGSNSVRLVVYEGLGRNPMSIFNEKAVLRLGRGLQTTGCLDAEAMEQALTILSRYRAVARAMGARPVEILATAAVREARDGPDFVRRLEERLRDVPVRVLVGRRGGRAFLRRSSVGHSRSGWADGRHRRRLIGTGPY